MKHGCFPKFSNRVSGLDTTARLCAFTLRRATEDTEDTEVYTEKPKKERKLNFFSVPLSVSSVYSVAPPARRITKRCRVNVVPLSCPRSRGARNLRRGEYPVFRRQRRENNSQHHDDDRQSTSIRHVSIISLFVACPKFLR